MNEKNLNDLNAITKAWKEDIGSFRTHVRSDDEAVVKAAFDKIGVEYTPDLAKAVRTCASKPDSQVDQLLRDRASTYPVC